ncbi:Hypothetical predicted protein [Podarcis lilfordi]|uniref:Uncharacterized protein n=1 Tax=Podarcis lilfordi TaxID=74358 RepID=A0AA35JRF9_9SAUR|nr:Hypothetical predicted protein [Podarcis lilfordi]
MRDLKITATSSLRKPSLQREVAMDSKNGKVHTGKKPCTRIGLTADFSGCMYHSPVLGCPQMPLKY